MSEGSLISQVLPVLNPGGVVTFTRGDGTTGSYVMPADGLNAGSSFANQDTARLEWFFGPADKGSWINEYLRGMRAGWTVDQWRSAIDAAMAAA